MHGACWVQGSLAAVGALCGLALCFEPAARHRQEPTVERRLKTLFWGRAALLWGLFGVVWAIYVDALAPVLVDLMTFVGRIAAAIFGGLGPTR